jgi:hypothetical protein
MGLHWPVPDVFVFHHHLALNCSICFPSWCPRCRRDELQIMESAYGEDDSKWPSAGLDGPMCISRDCRDIAGGVTLLSNEERRAQLQSKVISAPSASASSGMGNLPRSHRDRIECPFRRSRTSRRTASTRPRPETGLVLHALSPACASSPLPGNPSSPPMIPCRGKSRRARARVCVRA